MAEQAYTHEGQSFVLVDGDIFRVGPAGERTLVAHLYDPDFRAKNYVTIDGQIHQVDPDTGERHRVTRRFQDGFEQATGLMSVERWHSDNTAQADAGKTTNYYNLGNRVTRVTTSKHSGTASMRFFAKHSAVQVSKASLAKNIMYFVKGDHVYFSAWYFLANTPDIYDVGGFTLFDLESSFMMSIGLRIIVRAKDALAFELELPKTKFNQNSGAEVAFPAGRWVRVQTHALLSDVDGHVQIWQDGQKVLDKSGRTLPFADTVYDRFEVGVTAIGKGSRYDKTLYLDDVVISDVPIP